MAKVLVTGASGFIGTHLVAALAGRGDEVTCLVRKTSRVEPLREAGARLALGDVIDGDSVAPAVAGRDIVYHLAGCLMAVDSREFYRVNQQGVAAVAAACAAQTSPPVLIVVSSLAAAGPAANGKPRVESDPPAPVSHYGRSKLAGERAAEAVADRVPVTIVRPPIVLGEGDRLSLPLFRSIARFGVHVVPDIRRRPYSVIHADDLVQLLILAAQRGKRLPPLEKADAAGRQGRYFAASDESPTYGELGRIIAAAMDRRSLWVIPATVPGVWLLGIAGEALSQIHRRPVFMNLDKVHEITAGPWLCSAEAAREDLRFAVRAPFTERIRQTCEWYRREGWL
jgi:nucleoside-diphosphate-sugar epimerase